MKVIAMVEIEFTSSEEDEKVEDLDDAIQALKDTFEEATVEMDFNIIHVAPLSEGYTLGGTESSSGE